MDLVRSCDLSEFVLGKRRLTRAQVKWVIMEVRQPLLTSGGLGGHEPFTASTHGSKRTAHPSPKTHPLAPLRRR